jgi:hypothetical protein
MADDTAKHSEHPSMCRTVISVSTLIHNEGRRMSTAISRRAKLAFTLLGSLCALSLGLISGPASAQAATSGYCTGWLGGQQSCAGAYRTLYQVYGWGDQGPVCVAIDGHAAYCSAGAGAGVYSAPVAVQWNRPLIWNVNGYKSNFVHGVALQP